jgi:hypothetical protein
MGSRNMAQSYHRQISTLKQMAMKSDCTKVIEQRVLREQGLLTEKTESFSSCSGGLGVALGDLEGHGLP